MDTNTIPTACAMVVTSSGRSPCGGEESTYNSTVEIYLTVIDQDGKILWKGLASGEATRFGRSYQAENYYEVLSDAVVNTVSSMLLAADFRNAMSWHCIGPPT